MFDAEWSTGDVLSVSPCFLFPFRTRFQVLGIIASVFPWLCDSDTETHAHIHVYPHLGNGSLDGAFPRRQSGR